MENVLVGIKGWQYENWQGQYYPEDLPEDWQLDFYSNQFYCTLIPQNQWLNWTEEDIEEIAETLEGESFYFTLEVKKCQGGVQLQRIKDILGSLFHGILVSDIINDDFYQSLSVKVTIKSKQPIINKDWSFKFNDDYYAGFPMLELDLAILSIEQKKTCLTEFKNSLPMQEEGLIYIKNTEKNTDNNINVEKAIEFQTLAELLGL